MTLIIGIDPGKSGGLALWQDKLGMTANRMPSTEQDVYWILKDAPGPTSYAYIEYVHSTPQMGVRSAFTFGQGYGFLRGVLVACSIPFEEVRPQVWMSEFGMKKAKSESKTQWKHRLRQKAQQLFPHLEVTLATADALLLCEYGRRQRCKMN